MTSDTTVAVLGLGAMGSRMARRWLDAGYQVTVWNRSPEAADELVQAGAQRAESPRQAAEGSAFVVSMLTDDDAARTVWLGEEGAVAGLAPEAVAIEMSTVTPGWIAELAVAVDAAGASLVESPVVGSRPQVEAGQLICLVGGEAAAVQACAPVLDAVAGRVVHLGELGQGAVAKLAVNTYFAAQITAASEVVGFLRRAGVEDERWLELFKNLPVVAPPIAAAMQGMAAGSFAPMFPVSLVEKDLRYFLEVANANEASRPLAGEIQGLFAQAIDRGLGDDNITGIVQIFS